MRYTPATYAAAFWRAVEKKGVTPEITGNFLRLVRRSGDLPKLPEILRRIEKLFYKKSGIKKIEVTTARDMRKELEPKIRERFGKADEINFSTKPEIVGGVIIKINDETIIDASVKARLQKMFLYH